MKILKSIKGNYIYMELFFWGRIKKLLRKKKKCNKILL